MGVERYFCADISRVLRACKVKNTIERGKDGKKILYVGDGALCPFCNGYDLFESAFHKECFYRLSDKPLVNLFVPDMRAVHIILVPSLRGV